MQQSDLFSTDNFSTDTKTDILLESNVSQALPGSNAWLTEFFGITADQQLPDGEQRFQGVHPHHSYIVQAPAGSGKTSLLSQRFLALLSQVDMPEKIVAMTFTKKAAAEMRERIIEALSFGLKPLDEQASLVEVNTWKLAQKALQRDQEQGWALLQNPNRLRIKTIDGLNSYLVGQMPLLSKVGGQPQLLQDASAAYQEAVRQVLKMPELEQPVGRLLRLVNGRFNRAENLLMSMLAKRDQWMRTLIQYHGEEARQHLEQAIQEIVSKTLQQQKEALFYLGDAFSEACQLAEYATQHNQPQLQVLCGAWPFSEEDSEQTIEKWRVLADWLLTKDNKSVRKSVTKNNGFPAGKGEAKENKDRFLAVLESIRQAAANDSKVLAALVALKGLPNPHYSDQQWRDLQWLIELLTMCVAHLKMVFQQSAQADYIEIAQAASTALGSELEPTDLAQQLDYQIQHLLVDEFQDTSSEQYRLLMQLIAGWQADDGRTLFLVGDPMQSIYRFREAEVGNFLKAWQGQVGSVTLQPLNLTVNFRSAAGVVNWVNQAFKKVLPKENEIEKGAVTYSESEAFSQDNQPAVQPHWQLNQSEQQESEAILKVIQQRLAELASEHTTQGAQGKQKKIAILGRSRSSLTGIAQLLKQHQIGFRAVELESLYERQEIQDVLALTRALLHLADKEAWIALLRSPLVGLSLKDMSILFGDMPYQTVWSAIKRCRNTKDATQDWCFESLPELSQEAQARLSTCLPIIENALARLGSLSFATLVRETWIQLDGPLTVENHLALENVETYCHTLASTEESGMNLQQLEKQMDSLFARPDSSMESQQIELMTMHKSKGLEFDTVILPGLGRKPRGDDSELVSWFQFLSNAGEEQLVIAPIDQKGQATSNLRLLLKGFEAEKQNYELGRLLYVAATRAKTKLHLFGQVKYQPTAKQIENSTAQVIPVKDSLLASLWPYVGKAFVELANSYEFAEQVETEEQQACPKVSRLPMQRNGFANLSTESALKSQLLAHIETARNNQENQLHLAQNQEQQDELQQPHTDSELVFSQQNALLNTSVGNLVHAIFEQMVNEQTDHWTLQVLQARLPVYKQWLSQQGLHESQMAEAMRRVEQSVTHAIQNDKVLWALSNVHQESATEYPLTSLENGVVANHIVDRTFVDENNIRWIVDYKTSVYDDNNKEKFLEKQVEKYRPQLERYGKLFNQIEQRPQKWVLYFSYLDIWQEVN